MSSKHDKDPKLTARARRLALEKQMAAQPDEAGAEASKKPETTAAKSARAPMSRRKKVLVWTGGSILGLILVLLLIVGGIWLSAGGAYQHDLKNLIPADALLVVELDSLGSDLDLLDQRISELYAGRRSVRDLQDSALWREEFKTTLEDLHKKSFQGAIASARTTLANLPVKVALEADLLGKKTLFALVADASKKSTDSLIMTRVSQEIAFAWSFRGFGEGQHGDTTIGAEGDFLTIKGKQGDATYLALFDDVLAISSSSALLTRTQASFALDSEGGFAALALLPRAQAAVEGIKYAGKAPSVHAFANLDAIREYQGQDADDPLGRAAIDTYFSPSLQVQKMSQEIMPTVSNVLEHSIDTRLYKMAAWNLRLTPEDGILVDQFLLAPEGELKAYPKVQAAMQTKPADMGFLKFVPQGTWMVATMRQPIEEIRKATRPPVGEDGKLKASAIYSFMKALESQNNGAEPDSIGLALLPQRFSPSKSKDARETKAKQPPNIVSKVPFPPFALFLHWPGVKEQDVENLLTTQLKDLQAKETRLVRKIIDGQSYYSLFNNAMTTDQGISGWLNNIAAVAIDDYLVFAYGGLEGRTKEDANGLTGYNTVIKVVADLARGRNNEVPLESSLSDIWRETGNQHNALVHFNPERFLSYVNEVDLVSYLATAKFDEDTPMGMSPRSFRKMIADELGIDEAKTGVNARVGAEYTRRKNEWLLGKTGYAADLRSNLMGLNFLKDFTALTTLTPEEMHTRFVIRLGS